MFYGIQNQYTHRLLMEEVDGGSGQEHLFSA